MRTAFLQLAGVALGSCGALIVCQASFADDAPQQRPAPPICINLLKPLPTTGGVPPMFVAEEGLWFPSEGAPAVEEFKVAAERLARRLGVSRSFEAQAELTAALEGFRDQRTFQTLYESLASRGQTASSALMSHFAQSGAGGQAALAWMAIEDSDPAVRHQAARLITQPASNAVLATIDGALRSKNHERVNRAGLLSGQLQATAAIPLLIFAQFARDPASRTGDLAWIAIGTQISYVANLVPVLGDGSGAFAPIIGQITEGVVMRVQDAVVYTVRADVHSSLIALSSYDWGQDTGYLAWDMPSWARWFNSQYVPFKQAQANLPALPGQASSSAVP